MIRISSVIVAGCVLMSVTLCARAAALVEGATRAERVLTLEDSVATAVRNSQELLSFNERIEYAKQRVNEARAQNIPKIDLNLTAAKFSNDMPTVLSPSFGSVYVPEGTKDIYYSSRFSLWQYLYASGRYTTTVRLAEFNLAQVKSQAEITRNKVILNVKKAFYASRILQEKIAACRESSDVSNPRRGGMSAASFDDALASARLEELEHTYQRSLLSLLAELGLELDTRIALAGELLPPDDHYDLNKCLAWAYEFRPELRQTQFQETIDGLKVNMTLAERYPTVALGATYEWFGETMSLDRRNWNAAINVSLPIFDGWATWYRIKQQKNAARETQIRLAGIQDQVRLEVRQALMEYEFRRSQARGFDARFPADAAARKLERTLLKLDTLERLLASHAELEWAMGVTDNRHTR